MAPSIITEWPPEALMPVLKLAMLFGLAQGQGLLVHFLFAGPTLVGEILAGFIVGPAVPNLASIAQCGIFGALMAILSITLSLTFVAIALRVNGIPFIESVCGGCVMSASVVGLVDI